MATGLGQVHIPFVVFEWPGRRQFEHAFGALFAELTDSYHSPSKSSVISPSAFLFRAIPSSIASSAVRTALIIDQLCASVHQQHKWDVMSGS